MTVEQATALDSWMCLTRFGGGSTSSLSKQCAFLVLLLLLMP